MSIRFAPGYREGKRYFGSKTVRGFTGTRTRYMMYDPTANAIFRMYSTGAVKYRSSITLAKMLEWCEEGYMDWREILPPHLRMDDGL